MRPPQRLVPAGAWASPGFCIVRTMPGSQEKVERRSIRMINTESQAITQFKALPNMPWVPGGTFRMGSEDSYPEERPVHEVTVDGFWMDRYLLTNDLFSQFVDATGYITLAERELNPADFLGAPPENLVPGSM